MALGGPARPPQGRALGAVLSFLGDHETAAGELTCAEELLRGADVAEHARVIAEQGRVAARRGDAAEASRLRALARPTFESLGAALDLNALEDDGWI